MEIQNTTKIEMSTNNLDAIDRNAEIAKREGESAMPADKTDDLAKTKERGTEYSAISKDGDTLEIALKNEIVNTKYTDAALAKCSKTKLKQLLSSNQISRQQYEKAVKKAQ